MTQPTDIHAQLQAAIIEYGNASYREGLAVGEGRAARNAARARTDAAITAVVRLTNALNALATKGA